MSMPDVKTELPQASRKVLSKSRTDNKSVCPKDSGGGQTYGNEYQTYQQQNTTNCNLQYPITVNRLKINGTRRRVGAHKMGLSEVKRRGEQLIDLKSGHIFYNVDEEESSWGGIEFLIHKRHKSSILSLNKISTRVISLILKLNTRYNIKLI